MSGIIDKCGYSYIIKTQGTDGMILLCERQALPDGYYCGLHNIPKSNVPHCGHYYVKRDGRYFCRLCDKYIESQTFFYG